jgi:6-bladed beta-propeller
MSWEAAVDTIGDTIVVRTTAGQIWSDTADLVAEVSIGEMDGADEYIFGRISAIGVGQAGEIVVVDQQVPAVRIYGPDGIHRMTLGREGSGPGEFKRPDGGLAVIDERILIRDPGNGRITVYGLDGEYQANWLTHGGFNTSRKLYRDADGNAYSMALKVQGVSLDEWQMVLVKYDRSGKAVDSLDAPTADLPPNYVEGRSENSMSRTSVPFMPGQNWSYSPRGYFVEAISTRYGIKLLREDQLHLLIEREYTPARVASGEADQERARIERNFRQFPNWKWNGPPIPATKPPFDDVWVADDGRIWARLYQAAVEEEDPFYDPSEDGTFPTRWVSPTVFDVFEPDGRYLGSVTAPKWFSPYPEPVFRGDYVWAVTRDDFDVQRVVRYRIQVRGEPTD